MAVSPKLLQVLKDMGQADLQVLATELVPALEEEIGILFPSVQASLAALEVAFNPMAIAALQSVISKIVL